MKCLSYVVIIVCMFRACASEFVPPKCPVNEADLDRLQSRYWTGRPQRNSYDTTELKQRLVAKVNEDPIATTAMGIFLDCMFWNLVDECEANLSRMFEENQQLFRELLILLAPHLAIGNYKEKVVSIIGDRDSVTPWYFQHRAWVHDLFFYVAVECGRRGYGWMLVETCVNACTQLRIFAYDLSWPEYDQFCKSDVRRAVDNRRRTEDRLPLAFTTVWPNLESRVIPA